MVEFAPLNTPLKQRLQTLAALAWIMTLVVGMAAGWIIWALLVYFCSWWWKIPLLTYAVWIYLDRGAAETGARRSKWVRSWSWWKYFTDYFPAKLVKTAELSPNKNYILATFPHGVLCSGAFCAFAAEYGNFEQIFPGVRSHILTLASHFNTPLIRELVLAMGSLPASASCIRRTLTSEEKGQALCLMVGGAKEALYTHPGVYKVYVNNRKGFVRLAIDCGASLVPVIAFGEPELYDQVETEGTWLRTVQDFYKKLTGIAPLLFVGRGVFQYSYGIVPRRHPLNVVVGKPIDVEQSANPTEEQINKIHTEFVKSLKELFDAEKSKYIDPNTELIITWDTYLAMKMLGINFAPLRMPLQRRAETLAALGWISLMLLGAMTSWAFFTWAIISSSVFRLPCLLYALWMFWDRASVESGQRRSNWVRGWGWWRNLSSYFPVRLVKTAQLSPDRSYLFVTFPHGILSLGPFCAFSTDGCNFQKVFPGLTPHIATLTMHFVTPFIRELSLAMGSLPATEEIMVRSLSTPGKAICLVAGGAAEAFHSSPGQYKILMERRRGFIRVALKSGASLVPTIAFGEPDVYEQISCAPGSFLRWTQDQYKKMTGIAPVYLKGRGVFQYTWGLLPFRRPITVVAGKPIHVEKITTPSEEDINIVHKRFCQEWLELFESEKPKYMNDDQDAVLLCL